MKGSVFVLLGCIALFAAPSHSYSIKFISEDDQLANRQDTQSGSPSPDVATTGDAVENTDTSAGESKTIKTDGAAKPGDESVSGDAQAEKSNIRKRDTRSFVRDMMVNMDEASSKPINKDLALYFLRLLGDYSDKCFKQVLSYLQEHEPPNDSGVALGDKGGFSRSSMNRWLKTIQGSMSQCLRNMVEPLNGAELAYDDDDTPNSVRPYSELDPLTVSEFLSWLTEIGRSIEKCLKDAMRTLEATYQGPGDTVQRSSETFSDLLAELIEILAQIDGGAFAAGEQVQIHPQGQTVPLFPDSVPVIPTHKQSNFPDKPRGYRHYSNLPGFVFEYPSFIYSKDMPSTILSKFPGFREEAVQPPYTPGITTLPEDVNALPNTQLSLLSIVLDKIYSKLQGRVSPAVNIEAAPVESLRGDANGALGLYPGNRESLAMGNLGILDPDFSKCVEECMNKKVQ